MAEVRLLVSLTAHGLEVRVGGGVILMRTMANEQGQAVELGADELLLASLGACTSNTLQNLADQRGWLLDAVDVDLRLLRHGGKTSIERVVAIAGDIDDQQREQFLEAVERTPLTILLKSGVSIKTEPA